MTICKKCKWYYNSENDPFSCRTPKVITYSPIDCSIEYVPCLSINQDGQCPHYEEKQSWYRKLRAWMVLDRLVVGSISFLLIILFTILLSAL